MDLDNIFKPAPKFLPKINIGAGFDIPTGSYLKGKNGENILNGGLSYLTGVVGGGNMFKSTIMWYMLLSALNRIGASKGLVYDTEISLQMSRMIQLAQHMDRIGGGQDIEALKKLVLTNAVVYSGNKFYDVLTQVTRYRETNPKDFMLDSPFIDELGAFIKLHVPYLVGMDSLSNFTADAVVKIQEENEIGESGRNMEAMRGSLIKTQMLMELPTLTAGSGTYMMMSAHMGKAHQLDSYAPNSKELQHMKQDLKLKNAPEKFKFLTNNCWWTKAASVMERDKTPEFPRDSDDNLKGDTDLNLISLVNLRGKSGMTGIPLELVVSQTEGVLPGLTALKMMKTFKFGLGGNDRTYFNMLMPNENIQRTTARSKLQSNAKLARAFEITMEMCQIYNLWHDFDSRLVIAPDEVYAKIKEKGYDWDQLLDTRGYWVFNNESKEHKPFLSTKDILEMAVGDYKPYWLKN